METKEKPIPALGHILRKMRPQIQLAHLEDHMIGGPEPDHTILLDHNAWRWAGMEPGSSMHIAYCELRAVGEVGKHEVEAILVSSPAVLLSRRGWYERESSFGLWHLDVGCDSVLLDRLERYTEKATTYGCSYNMTKTDQKRFIAAVDRGYHICRSSVDSKKLLISYSCDGDPVGEATSYKEALDIIEKQTSRPLIHYFQANLQHFAR